MYNILMSFVSETTKGSLARKLIITVTMIIFIGGGISWLLLINKARTNLISNAINYTASHSDLLKKSIRYSMLTFHRDAIQQTIEHISSEKDIKKIRIFDSRGKVFYSSVHNEIGRQVNKDAFVCIGCHTDVNNPSETLKETNQWTIHRDNDGNRILTFINPIFNEPSCYTAECHAHTPEQRVLGILETDFTLLSVDKNIQDIFIYTTIYAIFFMLVSSVIMFYILRRMVISPVSQMSHAMKKVANGDLDHTVNLTSNDEMSVLAESFNMMTGELSTAREKMGRWTEELEKEVAKNTRDLKRSQDKLFQAEKLASLGRLTSDIAHEIRNPLTVIGGFARRLYKLTVDIKEKECAEIMVSEVTRLEKILRDVLTFSREAKYKLEKHEIPEVVSESLRLYQDLCEEYSIKIKREFHQNIVPVVIDKDQIRQALSNIINNAIDAMPSGGTLTVKAGMEDLHYVTYVFLKFSDTGEGIREEKLPFIFEPSSPRKRCTEPG